jgi:hypothetical protein
LQCCATETHAAEPTELLFRQSRGGVLGSWRHKRGPESPPPATPARVRWALALSRCSEANSHASGNAASQEEQRPNAGGHQRQAGQQGNRPGQRRSTGLRQRTGRSGGRGTGRSGSRGTGSSRSRGTGSSRSRRASHASPASPVVLRCGDLRNQQPHHRAHGQKHQDPLHEVPLS